MGRERVRAVFEREDSAASVEAGWSHRAQLRGCYRRASEDGEGLIHGGPGAGQVEAFEEGRRSEVRPGEQREAAGMEAWLMARDQV